MVFNVFTSCPPDVSPQNLGSGDISKLPERADSSPGTGLCPACISSFCGTDLHDLTHQKTSQAWLKLDPPKTGQATHQEQAKRGSNLTHQKQAKRGFKLDPPKTSQAWLKLDSPKTSQATHQHHTKNKPSSLPDGGRHREPWGALEFALVSLVLIFIHCARGAQEKQSRLGRRGKGRNREGYRNGEGERIRNTEKGERRRK